MLTYFEGEAAARSGSAKQRKGRVVVGSASAFDAEDVAKHGYCIFVDVGGGGGATAAKRSDGAFVFAAGAGADGSDERDRPSTASS